MPSVITIRLSIKRTHTHMYAHINRNQTKKQHVILTHYQSISLFFLKKQNIQMYESIKKINLTLNDIIRF